MAELFTYYKGKLKDFIAEALITKDKLLKIVIAPASENLVIDLQNIGISIDSSWFHTIDNSAVRHAIKSHGTHKEELRGQIPITNDDLMRIPEIVSSYDTIITEKNRRGQDILIYLKTMAEGIIYYVEEIRLGRHELATSTMYKRKKDDSPTLID